MNEQLKQPAPSPSTEAMEAAWSAALSEFHRSKITGPASPFARWVWPVAAAATIAILCGIIVVQSKTNRVTTDNSVVSPSVDLVQLFSHGRELFGDRLQAVTVEKDRVVWLLSEEVMPGPASDQVVTVILDRGTAPNLHIAVNPGVSMDVEQAGRICRIEFLPDVSGRIMAVGDGIYWDAGTPGSPMMEPRLRELCLNP